MSISKEKLISAAKDINSIFEDADAPIKMDTKNTPDFLTKKIKAASEHLEDGDALLQSTIDVLLELECDLPAKLKVKKAVKESKSKDEKKEKPAVAKGPGVIATIAEIVKTKGPITADGILTILVKKFPDREEKSMRNTIKIQLPNRMATERKMKIVTTDKGFLVK